MLCLMIICALLLPLTLLFDFIFIFEGGHFRGCEESRGGFLSDSNSKALKMYLKSYEWKKNDGKQNKMEVNK